MIGFFVFSLIKIFIKHLQDSIISIYLSVMLLMTNLSQLLQLWLLGGTQAYFPLSYNFHSIIFFRIILSRRLSSKMRLHMMSPNQTTHVMDNWYLVTPPIFLGVARLGRSGGNVWRFPLNDQCGFIKWTWRAFVIDRRN